MLPCHFHDVVTILLGRNLAKYCFNRTQKPWIMTTLSFSTPNLVRSQTSWPTMHKRRIG